MMNDLKITFLISAVLAFGMIGGAAYAWKNAEPVEPARLPILECRDIVTNTLFLLDPAKTYEQTLNLGGENYSYFDLPDGRTIKVSESWAATACRKAPTESLSTWPPDRPSERKR